MRLLNIVPLFLLAAGLYAQNPAITSIQNPASNILPGLPNFGIAQGQIFVLYGTNMGPATATQPTALPWPTNFAGVTVKLTPPGGTPVNAPIIYVASTQIAAIMPSNFPLTVNSAFATVQVTYNGVVGSNFLVRVVDTNFGISTVDPATAGTGTAVLTDANYNVISTTSSAKPGSTYAMWGTGLGAANSDNNIATNGDLGTPIQVFVGGIQAIVTYRGRSGAPGLDQINFTIPQGVTGCYVSLVVQTTSTFSGTRVSNGPTIPIALDGGTCSDVTSFPLNTINAALKAKGSVVLGGASIDGNKNQAIGFFLRFTPSQFAAAQKQILSTVSPGSCATYIFTGQGGSGGGIPDSTGLDAGSVLTLTPPTGSAITLLPVQTGAYGGLLPSVSSGSYKVSNGSGGTAIGPLTFTFNGPPPFSWTNSTISVVPRNAGLKITWTGGDANSTVEVYGTVAGNPITINGTPTPSNNNLKFDCLAPAAAGSFTIPATVLLAAPPVTGTNLNGTIGVQLHSNPQTLTIPGADYGFASVSNPAVETQVSFQ